MSACLCLHMKLNLVLLGRPIAKGFCISFLCLVIDLSVCFTSEASWQPNPAACVDGGMPDLVGWCLVYIL